MKAVWNKPLQIYLTALIALQILPLVAIVPSWVFAVSLGFVAWKALSLWKGVALPARKQISIFAVLGILGVWATKRTLLGEDAATAGLAIIAGCKLLETNKYRDVMMAVVLCFLLLMVQLLFSQGFGTMAFLIVDVLLLVQLLLQLHPSNASLLSFKVVGKLLLMVFPIWVILFFVFPRFTVGFWRREVPVVTSGFSEDMNPGLINQVVQTDEIAFRVKFDGDAPKPTDVYFRGAILATTEGLHWMKAPRAVPLESWETRYRETYPSYDYELFLEPIFRRWLFNLDYYDPRKPITVPGVSAAPANGGVTEAARSISTRVSYRATGSQMPFIQRKLSDVERFAYIQLPPDLDRRIYELAFDLRASNSSEIQSLTNMITWFVSNKFLFSIQPGEVDDLSAFLFDRRIGFCEHYAAAAAVLLRAMGFPARVVVGFQGAEKNALGNYFIVRNRNAHAWAEVWVQRSGSGYWQRVDLTSAVAPARITLGADYYRLASQYPAGTDLTSESVQQAGQKSWDRLRNRLGLAIDALEMQWVRFLLTYDFQFQQRLISRFGIQNASRFTFVIIVVGILGLSFLILMWALQRREKKIDPILKEWRNFCAKLAKRGVVRRANEGPLDFIRRAQAALPDHQREIQEVGSRYLDLRYGPPASTHASAFEAFRFAVRRFRFEGS